MKYFFKNIYFMHKCSIGMPNFMPDGTSDPTRGGWEPPCGYVVAGN